LRDALGEPICQALDDASVIEIMLNPDGRLFVERLGRDMEVLANLDAGAADITSATSSTPCRRKRTASSLSSRISFLIRGHRFEGLLLPVVAAPSFTIRRRASRLIPFEDCVRDGMMTLAQRRRPAKRSLSRQDRPS